METENITGNVVGKVEAPGRKIGGDDRAAGITCTVPKSADAALLLGKGGSQISTSLDLEGVDASTPFRFGREGIGKFADPR